MTILVVFNHDEFESNLTRIMWQTIVQILTTLIFQIKIESSNF